MFLSPSSDRPRPISDTKKAKVRQPMYLSNMDSDRKTMAKTMLIGQINFRSVLPADKGSERRMATRRSAPPTPICAHSLKYSLCGA